MGVGVGVDLKRTEKWLRKSGFRYVKYVSGWNLTRECRAYYWKPGLTDSFVFSTGGSLDPVFSESDVRSLVESGDLQLALSLADELDGERSDFRLRFNW